MQQSHPSRACNNHTHAHMFVISFRVCILIYCVCSSCTVCASWKVVALVRRVLPKAPHILNSSCPIQAHHGRPSRCYVSTKSSAKCSSCSSKSLGSCHWQQPWRDTEKRHWTKNKPILKKPACAAPTGSRLAKLGKASAKAEAAGKKEKSSRDGKQLAKRCSSCWATNGGQHWWQQWC